MSASPYSVHNELAAWDDVQALEKGLAYAQAVLAERF
jgi:hypothetical protein